MVADVRRHDEAERLVTAAVDERGAVDILVNNAGIGRFGPASELTVDAWIETIETKLCPACSTAAAPRSSVTRQGRIRAHCAASYGFSRWGHRKVCT